MKNLFISTLIILSTSLTYAETTTRPNTEKYVKPQYVSWLRSPKPVYENNDLQGQDRTITIKIYADVNGRIEKTEVLKSSGLPKLDAKVERAVKSAKFRPYTENGIRYPITAEQPFELKSSSGNSYEDYKSECVYHFKSKNLDIQRKVTKTPFNYESKPQLKITKQELENKDRALDIEFKLSRKNEISDLKVINSSGLKKLDDEVSQAISKTKITAPRKFYQIYKLKFTDQIYFNLKDCE